MFYKDKKEIVNFLENGLLMLIFFQLFLIPNLI